MIGIDTNILVALLVSSSELHSKAITKINEKEHSFCTTQTNIGELIRLLTHPKVFTKPLSIEKAVNSFSNFIDCFHITLLEDNSDWWRELPQLTQDIPGLKGNEIFDSKIALCLKYNGVKQFLTQDSDFKKYSFLKVISI